MGKGEGAHSETPEERFKLSESYRIHEADYAAEIERRIAALERQVAMLTPSAIARCRPCMRAPTIVSE